MPVDFLCTARWRLLKKNRLAIMDIQYIPTWNTCCYTGSHWLWVLEHIDYGTGLVIHEMMSKLGDTQPHTQRISLHNRTWSSCRCWVNLFTVCFRITSNPPSSTLKGSSTMTCVTLSVRTWVSKWLSLAFSDIQLSSGYVDWTDWTLQTRLTWTLTLAHPDLVREHLWKWACRSQGVTQKRQKPGLCSAETTL